MVAPTFHAVVDSVQVRSGPEWLTLTALLWTYGLGLTPKQILKCRTNNSKRKGVEPPRRHSQKMTKTPKEKEVESRLRGGVRSQDSSKA